MLFESLIEFVCLICLCSANNIVYIVQEEAQLTQWYCRARSGATGKITFKFQDCSNGAVLNDIYIYILHPQQPKLELIFLWVNSLPMVLLLRPTLICYYTHTPWKRIYLLFATVSCSIVESVSAGGYRSRTTSVHIGASLITYRAHRIYRHAHCECDWLPAMLIAWCLLVGRSNV